MTHTVSLLVFASLREKVLVMVKASLHSFAFHSIICCGLAGRLFVMVKTGFLLPINAKHQTHIHFTSSIHEIRI